MKKIKAIFKRRRQSWSFMYDKSICIKNLYYINLAAEKIHEFINMKLKELKLEFGINWIVR